jgi:hypothetical protein
MDIQPHKSLVLKYILLMIKNQGSLSVQQAERATARQYLGNECSYNCYKNN